MAQKKSTAKKSTTKKSETKKKTTTKKDEKVKLTFSPILSAATRFKILLRDKKIEEVNGRKVPVVTPKIEGLPIEFVVNKDEIVEVTQEQFEQLQSMGFVESDEAYEKRRKFIEDIDPQHPSKPTWDSVARENEFWLTLRDSEKIYNDVLIRV